jgi:hypothetical protein
MHEENGIGDGERFFYVMCHVERREALGADPRRRLLAEPTAERRVEGG